MRSSSASLLSPWSQNLLCDCVSGGSGGLRGVAAAVAGQGVKTKALLSGSAFDPPKRRKFLALPKEACA